MKSANPNANIDRQLLKDFLKQQVLAAYITGLVYGKNGQTLEQAQDAGTLNSAVATIDEGLIAQLPMLNAFVALALQSKGYSDAATNQVYQELM